MSRYWSAAIRELSPYTPGEQPKMAGLVKLNTNENPYGPSASVLAAIASANDGGLRLYPDPDASALRAALAAHHSLAPEQVFVGNGSDEVLALAFMALLRQPQPVWFPDITYSFYPVYCRLFDIAFRTVPLAADFSLHPADYLPHDGQRAGGILFANPNAPTGRLLSLAAVEEIVAANPECVVLVDEAYIDFGGDSAVRLIERHANLLVVQTFSKSRALAGLRVGCAFGHADLINGLERVKNSFNSYPLDRLAQAGAFASLADHDWFADTCARVIATRSRLVAELTAFGFDVLPSHANFVFACHPAHDGGALATALRARAIIVRHFRQPRIEQFLRITIGTEAECDQLIAALREILAG